MKVNNGLLKAYSRTTDKLVAVWPVTLERNEYGRFCVTAPVLDGVFAEPKFYTTAQEAANSIRGGDEWYRIDVEWTDR